MSEEEKKAIEILQHYLEMEEFDSAGDFLISIDKLLNLTKKQQKEIEHELNQRKYWRDNFYKQQKEIEELKKEYISKDKIREKIKELEQIQNTALTGTTIEVMDYKITILKQLLEE